MAKWLVHNYIVHKSTQPNANSANNTGKIAISRVSGAHPADTIPSLQQKQQQQQPQQQKQLQRSVKKNWK